jgi:two-component system, chemotaxis family, response regulator Rcp1
VLIVEDNESDVFLIREAIKAAKLSVMLHIVKDGEQAVRFFDRVDSDANTPSPALVILDINLPKKQGDEVLKYMRQSRNCAKSLVIAISSSESARDRELMTNLGADGYFRKPSDYDDFMKLGEIVKALLGGSIPQ